METDYSKKWYARSAEIEGDCEIGAGSPPTHRNHFPHREQMETRLALGQYIELWRRSKGWNVEQLAREAGIPTEEILDIEHNPQHCPRPETILKLASTFKVSWKRLMELAGLIEISCLHLKTEAIHFMAKSEPVEDLKENEREALESFSRTLSDEPLGV